MSITIPAALLKPLAAIAAKWAESALKRWLDKRRARRKAAGKWMRPVAGILLVAGLSGCGTLNLLLDRATEAWMPEAGAPAATNAPPATDWAGIKWHGQSFANAKQTVVLTASVSGDKIAFSWDRWPWGEKMGLGHFFWWTGSNWEGGKFDWIRAPGQKIKLSENITKGYNGLRVPEPGARIAFAWTSPDGTERTSLAETTWPGTPTGEHKPEGREIPTIAVPDGDGLWKPDTKTYLVPTTQRKAVPGPGWSANGQPIKASHIGRAVWCGPDGTVKGSLRWPGKAGTEDEKNYFGRWVRLLSARCASGDTIRVYDIYGQQICELPVPDAKKRAEGRR